MTKSLIFGLLMVPSVMMGQEQAEQHGWWTQNIEQTIEMQASVSDGFTPLWLNANKYGLSSLNASNAYLRYTLERPTTGSARKFDVGYGVDFALPVGYKDPGHTTHFILQQAYVNLLYGWGELTIGQRQQPMELRNNRLSSGAQTLGINARPVPQVRLGVKDYWSVPFVNGWVSIKAHMAYGVMTDGQWQEDFANQQNWWTHRTLYHEKAGYVRFGKEEKFPLTLTLGLEMAAQFGGEVHEVWKNGKHFEHHPQKNLRAFWNAFSASGHEWNEDGIVYQNVDGNQVGSWVGRLDWKGQNVNLGLYVDHFFEDHSSMFFLDYDGYGQGADWDTHVKTNFFQYRLRDGQIGVDAELLHCDWLQHVTLEWMNTRYQSGPIYHDHTPNMSQHISGRDDYYNHMTYAGWMHYGQVIGNPLFRSAVYNEDCVINVQDNRFRAIHLGLSGQLTERLSYRMLASWQSGLGTYFYPYSEVRHNSSYMLEGTYAVTSNLSLKVAFGMDRGSILGDNTGAQFTLQYKLGANE